jgi:hypothetical protein
MLSPFLSGKSPCCCFHNRTFLYLSAAKLRFSENKTKKFFLFLPSVRISLALCTFRSKNFALFLQRKDTHYSPILQSLEEKYPFVSVCQRSLSRRSLKERVEYRSESPDLNPDLNSLALPSYAMVTFSAVTSPTCNSTLPRVPLSANRSSWRNKSGRARRLSYNLTPTKARA